MVKLVGFVAIFLFQAVVSTAEQEAVKPAAQSAQQALSFAEAVDLSTQRNLNVRLAKAQSDSARAAALQSAASLLPSITGTLSQTRVLRENLAALGFSANPLFPKLIGPFNVFDARFQLVEKILDFSAIRQYQSNRLRAKVAQSQESLVRDQVAAAAGLAFVEALHSQKASEAAKADLTLATVLMRLAEDQHRAGVSTGVDVARARTRASQARLKLLQSNVSDREAKLRLKRVAGIALGKEIVLVENQNSGNPPVPDAESAVQSASKERLEIRLAQERLEADEYALQAARFQYFPSIQVNANYGLSGNLPNRGADPTGALGVGLQMPIWPSVTIRGQIEQAKASRSQSQALLEDARQQVEEDVRLSLEALETSIEEVKTADETLSLANQELSLARDRFSAGVGDNVELVNAQDVLAQARDAQVTAIAGMGVARINLALAMGRMAGFQL